jgi:hypothetical protein
MPRRPVAVGLLLLLLGMTGLHAQSTTPAPLPIDPAIAAALEAARSGEEVVTLTGYVGPTTAGIVRVYATRTLGLWFDVPEAAIVHVVPPERPGSGPSVLHLRAGAPIVSARQGSASALIGARRPSSVLPISRSTLSRTSGVCQAQLDNCVLWAAECPWSPAACVLAYACTFSYESVCF